MRVGGAQAGELREYVLQEANVRDVEICQDPLEYASVRAEPNYEARRARSACALLLHSSDAALVLPPFTLPLCAIL